MNIQNHEAKPGSAAIIAEVSLGLRSYKKVETGHGVTEVTVYTETPDFVTGSFTDIVVTSGKGLLIFKDSEGNIESSLELETGKTALLAPGVRYSYWAETGVFKVLEFANPEQVTPETSEVVFDLQQ